METWTPAVCRLILRHTRFHEVQLPLLDSEPLERGAEPPRGAAAAAAQRLGKTHPASHDTRGVFFWGGGGQLFFFGGEGGGGGCVPFFKHTYVYRYIYI